MKNKFEIRDDKVAIFLNRKTGENLETIISREDLGRAQELDGTWYANWCKSTQSFYVHGNTLGGRGKRRVGLLLHRLIMNCPDGLEVDHRNHDTLDNTRRNMRNVMKVVNLQNRKEERLRSNTSGYKGVSFSKSMGKWIVQKMLNGKNCYFGSFRDLDQAVQVSRNLKENIYG